ncbi:MAG: hypothetical protein KatS3mg111_2003 [Pirellulaceae bacterium]|nr:MAG: hypothetical protein KatS3mg111_2003 [Pirellulaceae bacterium]
MGPVKAESYQDRPDDDASLGATQLKNPYVPTHAEHLAPPPSPLPPPAWLNVDPVTNLLQLAALPAGGILGYLIGAILIARLLSSDPLVAGSLGAVIGSGLLFVLAGLWGQYYRRRS